MTRSSLPASREGLAAFDQALLDACVLLRPPEKLTGSEWADKYFYLSAEGSAQPGKWYTSNAEYGREPLDALTDPEIQEEVLMWGSQLGKTAIGLIGIGIFAQYDPSPQIAVQPTEDMAKAVMKDRIAPMLRDNPVLTRIFLKARGEEWNNRSYPGGQLTMAWANSPAQLASRAKRFGWTDEEGRYGQNSEGDPVDQLKKRLATFKARRKHLRTSSPALRRTCRITKAYEKSDQRHFYVPCPECGHKQTLRWQRMQWTRESLDPDNIQLTDCWYECEACEHHIHEEDKHAMVRAGEWRADNPGGGDGKTRGYHLNALYSTIGYEWPEVVQAFLKCAGIPDKLQVFWNTVLAEPWDEQAEGADMGELQKRAEQYAAQAPAWSVLFTVGADVQKDRIEATRWGWGENDVAGVIEHRVFYGDTSQGRRGAWLEFDNWRRTRVEHESGLLLPTACTFIDSGDGNRTAAVYEYCRWREAEKVYACKGSSSAGAPLVELPRRKGRARVLHAMVGSSTAKDLLFGRLAIVDPAKPGYIHFPEYSPATGTGPEFYAQLTAEKLVTHSTKGGDTSAWEKQRARNEVLDCAVYALAARALILVPIRVLAGKLAAAAARLTPEERDRYKGLGRVVSMLEVAVQNRAAALKEAGVPVSQHPPMSQKRKAGRRLIRRPGHGWING